MTTQNNGHAASQQNGASAPAIQKSKGELMMDFFQKDSVQQQLKNALKDNASEFIASVVDLYTGDKTLISCDPAQVAMQALKAAVLKLPIIKALGFAYIVPYKGVPTFVIGYKGLIQLAIRTNQYKIINADVVYEGEFRSANKLTGEYDLNGAKKSDKVIGYFAHFELTSGFSKTLFMTKERVEAHAKKYSKSYSQDYSPWKTEFDAMALKTVVRGLISHWGIMSTEMQSALTDDDRDVAEKTLDEIRQNGNRTPMSMNTSVIDEAEMAGDSNHSNPSQNGPAF